jgi:hypothetical protein
MPRATHHQQYQRHQTLREITGARPDAIVRLEARAQVALTAFYEPDRDHTFESLRARQRELVEHYPSLPQQAGKAYAALMRLLPKLEALEGRPKQKGQKYETLVFSERVVWIDPNEMAKILVRSMKQRGAGYGRGRHEDAPS